MARPLRIAQVAPPMERVPPRAYGGTERIVYELVRELDRRGHEVTTFASADSEVPGRHVPTVDEALRPSGGRIRAKVLPRPRAARARAADRVPRGHLLARMVGDVEALQGLYLRVLGPPPSLSPLAP